MRLVSLEEVDCDGSGDQLEDSEDVGRGDEDSGVHFVSRVMFCGQHWKFVAIHQMITSPISLSTSWAEFNVKCIKDSLAGMTLSRKP